jgi:hypothetical protein
MLDRDMHRRRFLQTSGLAAAGMAAVQVGAILTDPHPARAMATAALNDHQARTLLVMARQLFPHDELGDQYYVAVVEALDAKAAADPAVARLLAAGVSELDAAMGIPFVDLSAGNQLRALEDIDGTEFFAAVRGTTLAALYNNDVVARHFGFEGSSVEFGGYIERGFNDIGWLPDA